MPMQLSQLKAFDPCTPIFDNLASGGPALDAGLLFDLAMRATHRGAEDKGSVSNQIILITQSYYLL